MNELILLHKEKLWDQLSQNWNYFSKPIFTTSPPRLSVLWSCHDGSVLGSVFMGIQAFFFQNLKCVGLEMKQMPFMTAQ